MHSRRDRRPLPFSYQSTGVETRFTNWLDPEPRAGRSSASTGPRPWPTGIEPRSARTRSSPTLASPYCAGLPDARARTGLWPAQVAAIRNLEESLADDRPRALIQMATGSGKTFTAVTSIYRLIKFGDARRVLFLVDRANLGRQALKEFQQFATPDDGRKFTELYNVQHLDLEHASTRSPRSCITTIQRLYSMLQGEAELDPELEEQSQFDELDPDREPVPVAYNPARPDRDVRRRSSSTSATARSTALWRQVLEYFDAFLDRPHGDAASRRSGSSTRTS